MSQLLINNCMIGAVTATFVAIAIIAWGGHQSSVPIITTGLIVFVVAIVAWTAISTLLLINLLTVLWSWFRNHSDTRR